MPDFLNSNDEAVFDRLVDGELSADDRLELLDSLDSSPNGWRRCAIAFLEAQSWGNDFRQFVRESDQPKKAIATPTVERATIHSPLRKVMTWAAIAASLLAAFSLGVMRRGNVAPLPDSSIANAPVDSARPDEPAVENTKDPDALTLWVHDETGQPRSIRVPLMDAVALDRELGVEFKPGMPANVRSRLRDDGYHVQSKRRYAPLWLENGQRMVLPVEDTKIVPVSENVY